MIWIEWMRDEINRQTMIDSLEEKYHGRERRKEREEIETKDKLRRRREVM